MATYNGEKFIHQQIASILLQLKHGDELIISDDGSTDNTISIIETFNESKIKVYKNSLGNGVIRNFENALSKANGKYIFLCDQDDIWLPEKVETCVKELHTYHLVVTDCAIVDERLATIEDSYFIKLNAGSGLIKNLKKNTYQGCCMCFTAEMMPLIMPFPRNIPMHDVWIGFVAELFFKIKFLPVKLVLYRRHTQTATHIHVGQSNASLLTKISYRLSLILQIPTLVVRRFFR